MSAAGKRRHPLRWAALGVGAVFVGLCIVLATQVSSDPVTESQRSRLVGRPAPSFELVSFDGSPISSEQLAGRTVVVNFWNDWCVPCRQEEPALQEFHAAHAGDADVVMIGILRAQDNVAAARRYAEEQGISWILAVDPDSRAALAFGTRAQPETYVITPDGVVAAAQIGPVRGIADLELMLAAGRGS